MVVSGCSCKGPVQAGHWDWDPNAYSATDLPCSRLTLQHSYCLPKHDP